MSRRRTSSWTTETEQDMEVCSYIDDEELAARLHAEELDSDVWYDVSTDHNGLNEFDTFVGYRGSVAEHEEDDYNFAKALQAAEDERAAVEKETDLKLLEVLQREEDEQHVHAMAARDTETDLELARALQDKEDFETSDYLIAKQLQEEFEKEHKEQMSGEGARCENCNEHHDDSARNSWSPPERLTRGLGFPSDFIRQSLLQVGQTLMPRQPLQPRMNRRPSRNRGRQSRREQDESEDDSENSYEELLQLEERIGDAGNQGLKRDELSALPTSRYKSSSQSTADTACNSSESSNCHICLCDFVENEKLRTLPCLHRFHCQCIDQWIKKKALCPVCRTEIKESL